MTKTEWNRLQKNLPAEDKMSYEDYIAAQKPTPAKAEPAPVAKAEPAPAAAAPATVAPSNVNPVAASIPVAGVVNTPSAPASESNSAASMPSTMPKTVTPAKALTVQEKLLPKLNTLLASMKENLADLYVSQGLNPDGTKKAVPVVTTTQKFQAARAAELGLTVEEAAGNPIFNKAVEPSAPAGFRYTWIGGTETGQWKLYANTGSTQAGGGNTLTGTGMSGNTTDAAATTGTPSTSVDVLKALLKAQGLSSKILDASTSYLNSLLKENIDYDNAIALFLNTKEYTLKNGTKMTSPFYSEYGYLNEGLASPKEAGELFNAVEGFKTLQQKYGFSEKYLSPDSLKNYVKNNVTVLDLDERANAARLAAITADPAKTDALIKLGYIASREGLQDFYLDAKIGKEQLEVNRNTGAFVAEAIRRSATGISTGTGQIEGMKALAATLTDKGYTEAQIAQLASTGFEEIGKTLEPLTKLENIYGVRADKEAIQKDLQTEEFLGMASELRKRRTEQEQLAFKKKSGVMGATRASGGSLGTRSSIGAI